MHQVCKSPVSLVATSSTDSVVQAVPQYLTIVPQHVLVPSTSYLLPPATCQLLLGPAHDMLTP